MMNGGKEKMLLRALSGALARLLSKPKVLKLASPLINYVYALYENYLYEQVRIGPIPQHVAIIPDGNRRWARERGLDTKEGHKHGYHKVREVLQWLYELGVKVVTLYAMSYENCLHRPWEERENLFNIIKEGLSELLEGDLVDKYKVRVKVFGKLDLIRKDVVELAERLEAKTRSYRGSYLNVAICYGGRQEIIEALKRIGEDILEGRIRVNDIDEDLLTKYLYTSHMVKELLEPDLVIRTAGEMRISNFLLWHIAYSELYFCDVYWPEFRRIDLLRAIRSYQRRERKFGR